uniref:Uncharacterized protein n=1 Tax=Chrysemys picta bellii TaxID=8478 RepID=A0A8C3HH92_CHRPI
WGLSTHPDIWGFFLYRLLLPPTSVPIFHICYLVTLAWGYPRPGAQQRGPSSDSAPGLWGMNESSEAHAMRRGSGSSAFSSAGTGGEGCDVMSVI